MTRPAVSRFARLAASASFVALLAACQSNPFAPGPRPVTVSDVVEATAVVESIDATKRRARLRTPEGRILNVQIGPQATRLDQVRPGDTVRVRYTEAIAAEVVKPGTAVGASTSVGGTQSASGAPGGTQSVTSRMVVRVAAVDTVNNTVDVTDPAGSPGVQRIRVQDSKAREFIRGLKPGDDVQITVTEAIAVSVEPAKR